MFFKESTMSRLQCEVSGHLSSMCESSGEDEIPDTPRPRSVYIRPQQQPKLKSQKKDDAGGLGHCRPSTPAPHSPVQLPIGHEVSLPWFSEVNNSGLEKFSVFNNQQSSDHSPALYNAATGLDDSSTRIADAKLDDCRPLCTRASGTVASESDGEFVSSQMKAARLTKKEKRTIRSRSLNLSDDDDEAVKHPSRKRKIGYIVTNVAKDSIIDEVLNDLEVKSSQMLQTSKSTDSQKSNKKGKSMATDGMSAVSENKLKASDHSLPTQSFEVDSPRDNGFASGLLNDKNLAMRGSGKYKLKKHCERRKRDVSSDSLREQTCSLSGRGIDAVSHSNCELSSSKPPGNRSSTLCEPCVFSEVLDSREAVGFCDATKPIVFDKRWSSDDRKSHKRSVVTKTGHCHSENSVDTSKPSSAGRETLNVGTYSKSSVEGFELGNVESFSCDNVQLKKSIGHKKSKRVPDDPWELLDCQKSVSADKPCSVTRKKHNYVCRSTRNRHRAILSDSDDSDDQKTSGQRCYEKQKNPISYIQIDSDVSTDDETIECSTSRSLSARKKTHMKQPFVKNSGSSTVRPRTKSANSHAVENVDTGGTSFSARRKHGASRISSEPSSKFGLSQSLVSSETFRRSPFNLDEDVASVAEVTGVNDRRKIETAVSRVCDCHGFYYIDDVINYLLNADDDREVWQQSVGDLTGSNSSEHLRKAHSFTAMYDIDPSYQRLMSGRINQFSDYQWQVHMAIHNGADVPQPPQGYCGPSPDSFVDSEVLQYMVHCRESGVTLPVRESSVSVGAHYRHFNTGELSGGGTGEASEVPTSSFRLARDLLRPNRQTRDGRITETTTRMRAPNPAIAGANEEQTGFASVRPQRSAVGRSQRSLNSPMDSVFQQLYSAYMGGSRREVGDADRRGSTNRRRRRRSQARSANPVDVDELDWFSVGSERNADRHASLLSRTHILDFSELADEEWNDHESMHVRRRARQPTSWIRGLHGHLSLLSRTHLLDMDESDDVSDEYEQLLSIIERVGDAVPRGLDPHIIRQLPTKSFAISEVKEGETVPECNICICEYADGDRLRILQCLHRFHAKCIDKWLSENRTCPICRVEVQI